MISTCHGDIVLITCMKNYKYLGFAAVLDAPVWIQQLRLSRLDHRFDFRSVSKIIIFIGSVQFVFGTLTHRAFVSRAHCRVRNLQPIHTQ